MGDFDGMLLGDLTGLALFAPQKVWEAEGWVWWNRAGTSAVEGYWLELSARAWQDHAVLFV